MDNDSNDRDVKKDYSLDSESTEVSTPKILVSSTPKVSKKVGRGSDKFFDKLFTELFGGFGNDVESMILDLASGEYDDNKTPDTPTNNITLPSDSENVVDLTPRIHVSKTPKVIENKVRGPIVMPMSTPTPNIKHKGPVATSTSQIMSYVTVKNIEIDTSYRQEHWSLFVLKELMDNAYDWLNACYPVRRKKNKAVTTAEDVTRRIGVRIWITSDSNNNNSEFIHIAVRNSNVNNEPVLLDLEDIFDYHIWRSTKRYQHNMTAGALGDALKRCLGMGYAIYTNDFNSSDTFEDKQWDEPIIVRRNQSEYRVFIKVDTSKPDILTDIQQIPVTRDIGNDTEVEVTLPIPDSLYGYEYDIMVDLCNLKKYYQDSKIAKRNIAFDFFCSEVE